MDKVLLTGETDERDAIEDALAVEGYELGFVSDAAGALDRLETTSVACLLLGNVPGTPGAAVDHFRRHGYRLPIVALADGTIPDVDDVAAIVPADDPDRAAERVASAVERYRLDRRRADRRRQQAAIDAARDAALDFDGEADDALGALCSALVDSPVYDGAWVGRYDEPGGSVSPTAAAGVPLSHLAAVSTDADTDSLTTWAIETGAVAAERSGDHATLAVPLGDGPAAVLHLVARRPDGVSAAERGLFEEFAEAVAPVVDERAVATPEGGDPITVLGDTLSHELGNQLDIATTHLELARDRGDDAHFGHVRDALDRLTDLADEAHLLASGEVDPQQVDLGEAATEAWAVTDTPNAQLEAVGGTVTADPDLLALVLENLLRNAVEHGATAARADGDGEEGEGGGDHGVTVRVEATETGFAVADDGPGIPPERSGEIFDWGQSAGETGGTGIGLGIVALVAERHGWSVSVSDSEDGGARFEFD